MTSLVLSRRAGSIRAPCITINRLYHAGKASSVNSAIYRGLRKSNGLAFRGKKIVPENDLREKYRLKHDLPEFKPSPGRRARNARSTMVGAQKVEGRTMRGRVMDSSPTKKLGRYDGHDDYELASKLENLQPPQSYARRPKKDSLAIYGKALGGLESTTRPWIRPASSQTPRSSTYEELPSQDFSGSRGRDLPARRRPDTSSAHDRVSSEGPVSISRTWIQPDPTASELENEYGRSPASSHGKVPLRPRRESGFDRSEFASVKETARRDLPRGSPARRMFLEKKRMHIESRASDQGSSSRFDRAAEPHQKGQEYTNDSSPPPARTIKDGMPISLPYTTPASQFLYGTSVVEGALISRRRRLYKLYIYMGENRDAANRDDEIIKLAHRAGVEVVKVGQDFLRVMDKMSTGRPHNGYILEASPLPQLPVKSLGQVISEDRHGFEVEVGYQSREEAEVNGTENFIELPPTMKKRNPFVLLLDSIADPGNLGGILRTASFLGVSAVAISARNSASFTPVVLKASAGASEDMTILMVNRPEGFIVDSKRAGWKVYAAVAPSKKNDPAMPLSLSTDHLQSPLADSPCILMLGSEGEGLRWNLRSKADVDVYIEGVDQHQGVDSLNVSVAAGILCNSFLRNSNGEMTATEPLLKSEKQATGVSEKPARELF